MSKDRYRPSLADFEVVETLGGATLGGDNTRFDSFRDGESPLGSGSDPGRLKVISQSIRYTPQGVMVVDVTLGWDPMSNADEYRIRVTEA